MFSQRIEQTRRCLAYRLDSWSAEFGGERLLAALAAPEVDIHGQPEKPPIGQDPLPEETVIVRDLYASALLGC